MVLNVWLRVETQDCTYRVSGRRPDYDDIVSWLESRTGIKVRESAYWKTNALFYRWRLRDILKAAMRTLRQRKAGPER